MAHAGIRKVIVRAGGVAGGGRMATHAGAPLETPFGTAEIVEGDRIRAIPVIPREAPPGVAFLGGIQRYSVDGWFGATPVVRAHVAAAALCRNGGELVTVATRHEDFLVAPLAVLSDSEREALAAREERLYPSEPGSRRHPLLEIQLAVQVVDRRRAEVEATVAKEYREAKPGGLLVVDGSVTAHSAFAKDSRLLGIVKSHETQFLNGADVVTAMTLEPGHRSSVFAPKYERGAPVHSWYVRLWPWEGQDITHGLVRVERYATDASVSEADEISGWLMRERAPLSTPDARWDRLLYPIHRVEDLLRAKAGSWS
ncbi:MAG: hypothetical protein EXR93_05985 [Gemmatimonadetes bacterium]|nr:hypothetical protein [Gemmatimonadota bacterium]